MPYELRHLLEQTFLVFAALFPVVNPIGGAPVFLMMTQGLTSEERAQLARRVGLNAFLVVIGAYLVGGYVIEFFGLSVPIIQVGGGLLVCAIAWNILNSDQTPDDVPVRSHSARELAVRAFYPLTMPLTTGPGTIAIAITLGAHVPPSIGARTLTAAGSIIGAALLALTIYLLFRYADRLTRALGEAGTQVVLRLSAFILLCIGVNIIWAGAFSLLQTIPTFRPR
jgi:multiple antibiotic resistance protein